MAVEALKSAGIAAYQGSSQTSTAKTIGTGQKPELSVVGAKSKKTSDKTPEKAAEKTAEKEKEAVAKKPEKKSATKSTDGNNRVQETSVSREPVKAPEPVILESRDTAEGKASTEGLKRAVEEINKKVVNSEAVFGVHDSTNRITIKIVDKETKEVLKEYPPEKTLDMIAKVWELAGLLVDEKR